MYQEYVASFDWFDLLLVGLTATPKDEAVAEGYLVPPPAVPVPLKFQREGIYYADLSEADKDTWDMLEWGEDEPPDEVSGEAVKLGREPRRRDGLGHLTPEKATEAITHLAGLPSAERDEDKPKRFGLLALRLQLSLLEADPGAERGTPHGATDRLRAGPSPQQP